MRMTSTERQHLHGRIENAVAGLRGVYPQEVERFALTLEPLFRRGKLRGFTDEDLERDAHLDHEESQRLIPWWRLEKLCGTHFRVGEPAGEEYRSARELVTAGAILAVSPSAEGTRGTWSSVAYWALTAVTWDVLLLARKRGWYTPAADEQWMPGDRRDCGDVPGLRVLAPKRTRRAA